jgi:hypothetical protein
MKVKTIDINVKEWFDKVNGNSYFAGEVVVNYGMKSEIIFNMPFQYGYGEQYVQEATTILNHKDLTKAENFCLWRYCKDNKIILRTNKEENCLQRELKAYNKK